jgi:hypothetical protein
VKKAVLTARRWQLLAPPRHADPSSAFLVLLDAPQGIKAHRRVAAQPRFSENATTLKKIFIPAYCGSFPARSRSRPHFP